MDPISAPQSVSAAIQLSVAPVFLMVAVGSMLNVMTSRLARVVDRARTLESMIIEGEPEREEQTHRQELTGLNKRMTYVQRAIVFNAIAAVLIAFLVALIFLSDLANQTADQAIASLFIMSMGAITIGLWFFLLEIFVATQTLRVRAEFLQKK